MSAPPASLAAQLIQHHEALDRISLACLIFVQCGPLKSLAAAKHEDSLSLGSRSAWPDSLLQFIESRLASTRQANETRVASHFEWAHVVLCCVVLYCIALARKARRRSVNRIARLQRAKEAARKVEPSSWVRSVDWSGVESRLVQVASTSDLLQYLFASTTAQVSKQASSRVLGPDARSRLASHDRRQKSSSKLSLLLLSAYYVPPRCTANFVEPAERAQRAAAPLKFASSSSEGRPKLHQPPEPAVAASRHRLAPPMSEPPTRSPPLASIVQPVSSPPSLPLDTTRPIIHV